MKFYVLSELMCSFLIKFWPKLTSAPYRIVRAFGTAAGRFVLGFWGRKRVCLAASFSRCNPEGRLEATEETSLGQACVVSAVICFFPRGVQAD